MPRLKFSVQDVMFLGFCATFIVITRAALRLHLNVPGHAMFFTMFLLILSRACVPRLGAATVTGFLAGIICALLGMGKGGPLIILKFVLPALVVDLGGMIRPAFFLSVPLCVTVGVVAAATRFLTITMVELLIGVEQTIVFQHAIVASALNMVFGGLGAAFVPAVARRLKAAKLIP